VLPRFDPDVPGKISRNGNDTTLANIADAMLREGVLCSLDWKGNLADTISAGLGRWANMVMGAADLRHYNLALTYSDNAAAADGLIGISINVSEEDTGGSPVGTFALAHDPYDLLPTVCVERQTLALEALQKDLGFGLLDLISDGMQWIGNGLSPKGAVYLQSMQDEYNREDGNDLETLPEDVLTVKRLKAAYPPGLFSTKFQPAALRQALAGKRGSARQIEILMRADLLRRRLMRLKQMVKRYDHPERFLGYDMDQSISMLMRWEDDDMITRVCDDYIEDLSVMGECSDIVSHYDFLSYDVDSVRAALRWLRLTLEILHCLDGLLDSMDSPAQQRIQI
jgi:PRTRC genetic system protein F